MRSLSWGSSTSGHEWRLEGPQGATATVPHDPRLVTEDMVALRQAALSGIIHATFPSRRGLLPSVRALLDYLAGEYAALTKAEQERANQFY